MEFKEYLSILRRHVALLIVTTLLGCLCGAGMWLLIPTTYSARTELFVSVSTSGDPYDLQMGSSFIRERIQTYVDMTGSAPVLQPVIDDLDLETTAEALASRVEAYGDPRTVLITVEATEFSPDAAQLLSGAVADSLVAVIGEMENPEADETSRIRLTVSNPPVTPQEADGPAGWLYATGGLPVGFALGLALALLRSALDNKLRSRDDLERLDVEAVLGSIPADSQAHQGRLLSQLSLDDTRGEAFRRLRTNLRFAQVDTSNSAVLVTSTQAKEGKSSTSINVAIAAAQTGSRVALVDVDLRQPTIADKMGLENSAGLTTVLLGAAELSEVLQPWGADELYVLTAGEMPPNPVELLDSRAMSALITRLTDEFDLVVLDGPPLMPVADSLILAKHVGQVMLVAGVGEVRLNHLQEALRSLSVLTVPTGIVLNKVPRSADEMRGYSARYPSRLAPSDDDEGGTGRPAGKTDSSSRSSGRRATVDDHDDDDDDLRLTGHLWGIEVKPDAHRLPSPPCRVREPLGERASTTQLRSQS